MAVGDWVLSIDGENAGSLTHIEAQNKIRACGERLSLGLSRCAGLQVAGWEVAGAVLASPVPSTHHPVHLLPSLPGLSRLRINRRRWAAAWGALGGGGGLVAGMPRLACPHPVTASAPFPVWEFLLGSGRQTLRGKVWGVEP